MQPPTHLSNRRGEWGEASLCRAHYQVQLAGLVHLLYSLAYHYSTLFLYAATLVATLFLILL